MGTTTKSAGASTYVVAGDWVVDEYWFLVRHYSETSKHTGREHFRLATGEDEKIKDLCGVGHVARVLHHLALPKKGDRQFEILALGNWSDGSDAAPGKRDERDNTPLLKHLIHSGPHQHPSSVSSDRDLCEAGLSKFRYGESICKTDVDGIELRALCDGATIRAIRFFQREKDDWVLHSRVDCEPPPRQDKTEPEIKLPHAKPQKQVQVLVIDDLEKGAITPTLVGKLLATYPNAQWYIRAKRFDPDWLAQIEPEKRELFVIGPEVAPQESAFERWHIDGRITSEGLRVLEKVAARNVILLSDRRDLIGRFETGRAKRIDQNTEYVVLSGESSVPPTAINQIGWADAVMAGFVYAMNPRSTTRSVHDLVERALVCADDPRYRVRTPGTGPWTKDPAPAAPKVYAHELNWSQEKDLWEKARRSSGFVEEDPYVLEVWRASARLKGYIACIKEKQEILSEIGGALRAFSRGSVARSVGILVQSDPGTGKTHLARCLAESFNFELLSCDIAQMVHREELFDFFDSIGTHQADNPDMPVLAFVDEINATIEGSPVYGAFLSPLESGVYARRGRLFTLKPCVWLCTGTNVSSAPDEKLSDFRSRMTLIEKIDYRSLLDMYPEGLPDGSARREEVTNGARLEQVYLGATMINYFFPDVTRLDPRLLDRFRLLDPLSAPFREIRQAAASLRNVKHGEVTMNNLPKSSPLRTEDAEERVDPKKMVRLVFKPGPPPKTQPAARRARSAPVANDPVVVRTR